MINEIQILLGTTGFCSTPQNLYNYYKVIVIEQQSLVLKQNYKPDPYHKKKPETHTQAIPL